MLEKFATCAPVTRFLTVQEMCRLRIGCEYSRRICNKRLFSKQLPINVVTAELTLVRGNFTDFGMPAQTVDATLAWSLLAGVWNPKVFLGR
jgi:hypothetical protein